MLWIALSVFAALVWSVVAVMDKYVVSHELRDSILATVSSGLGTFILFCAAALFKGSIITVPKTAMLSVAAGISYTIAIGIYYKVMQREEVSRFIALLGTIPFFVLLLGFFFLGERFTAAAYMGIALIVSGAVIVSLHRSRKISLLNPVALLALLAAFFFSLRTVLVKVAMGSTSIWPVIFWIGIGGGAVALLLLAVHHPHIRKKARLGIRHVFIIGSFNAVAFFIFTGALALGPASLVASITTGADPIFVLILAMILARYYPKSLHEEFTPHALVQKIAAIALIVAGALLML